MTSNTIYVCRGRRGQEEPERTPRMKGIGMKLTHTKVTPIGNRLDSPMFNRLKFYDVWRTRLIPRRKQFHIWHWPHECPDEIFATPAPLPSKKES